MKTFFYPRLAWDGLRKNRRLSVPYLLTCVCMVSVFYILSFLVSPDGLPMIQPEGHCILEQEFDSMGNVAVKRYYDDRNQPIAICDGYAEIRRTYNNKKQVIHEAYFDTEGKP